MTESLYFEIIKPETLSGSGELPWQKALHDEIHDFRLSESNYTIFEQAASFKTDKSESNFSRLARTSNVIGGGMIDGTLPAVREAIGDPDSLMKLAGSFVVGGGMALLLSKRGMLAQGARIGGLSFGAAFIGELADKTSEIADLAKMTWDSPIGNDFNRARMAELSGPFIVDLGLYGIGGSAGASAFSGAGGARYLSLARNRYRAQEAKPLSAKIDSESLRGFESHGNLSTAPSKTMLEIATFQPGMQTSTAQRLKFSRETPTAIAYEAAAPAIGRLEVLARTQNGRTEGRFGSSVTVSSDGKLVTNAHVIDDALSISVFDRSGSAHRAKVLARDSNADLALIQLTERESFSSFRPMEIRNTRNINDLKEINVIAAGHPEGSLALTLSPGILHNGIKRGNPLDLRFSAVVKEGNSGGALMDTQGKLIGIVKSGYDNGQVNASPSWALERLLSSSREKAALESAMSRHFEMVSTTTNQRTLDARLALENLELMFGKSMLGPLDPATRQSIFHSRVKLVELPGSSVTLKAEISPIKRSVTVEPIAVKGEPLTSGQTWPGTTTPLEGSRLLLRFSADFKSASISTRQDPLALLPKAFDFRGQNNYLSR